MEYAIFFFPKSADSIAASSLLYDSEIPVKVSRVPRELTGMPDGYCTRGVITKPEYAQHADDALKHSGKVTDYKIFRVGNGDATDGLKEFLKLWDSMDWPILTAARK